MTAQELANDVSDVAQLIIETLGKCDSVQQARIVANRLRRTIDDTCGQPAVIEARPQPVEPMEYNEAFHMAREILGLAVGRSEETLTHIVASLREQLATAQAEAAAMREALFAKPFGTSLTSIRTYVENNVDAYGTLGLWCREHVKRLRAIEQGTAGRELLDQMQRKDERIRELEQRVDELDAECASFADQAYDAAEPEEMSEAEIDALVSKVVGEQSPAWQYRWREPYAILYRGNESGVFQKLNSGSWQHSGTYDSWQACCDDPATYPCDEHGKRIDEPKSINDEVGTTGHNGLPVLDVDQFIVDKAIETDYERIADLERQLAKHNRDAELCRELRALLQSHAITTMIGEQCIVMVHAGAEWQRVMSYLISIRDGGAK